MIGDIEQQTNAARHEDLQIGNCERCIAGDPHIWQPGKMRDLLLDRPVMLGVRGAAGERCPPGRPGKLGAHFPTCAYEKSLSSVALFAVSQEIE
jgi:hypothetical protein